MLILLIIILIFAGSFLYYKIKSTDRNISNLEPKVTPPVTYSQTDIAKINPFNSPTPVFENPFLSPTPMYENPFGTYENPFKSASIASDLNNQPYANPFKDLK